MKKLVKWKVSAMVSILLVMVLAIYITIGSKGEEKSKYGVTSIARSGAVTYFKDADISITTPKTYMRFFQDASRKEISNELKRMDCDFAAISDDYVNYEEIYCLTDSVEDGYPKLTDDSVFDEEYVSWAVNRIKTTWPDMEFVNEPEAEVVTLGNKNFLRLTYLLKAKYSSEYNVVADYFYLYDGKCLEQRTYSLYGNLPEYETEIENVVSRFDSVVKGAEAGKILEDKSDDGYFWGRWKTLSFAPWIIVVPFIYMFLCGLTYMGKAIRITDKKGKTLYYVDDAGTGTGWNEEFLSLKTSKQLLGFFAILIVLHHLVQQSGPNDAGMLYILEDFGVGLVGVFFFFSGFGLFESYKKKTDYFKGFFKKRLPSVLIPFYTAVIVFISFELIENGWFGIKKLILTLLGWNLINSHTWYIIEIVILYTLFYVLFRFINNKKIALCLMFVLVSLMVVGSLLLGHGNSWFQGEWWYNTSLLFPFGIFFSMNKDKLVEFMKRFYVICLPVVSILFVVFYKATKYMLTNYSYWSEQGDYCGYLDKARCLAVQCPMVFFFVLLLLLLGMKLKIGNKALELLGSISLEIYVIHNLFISLFSVIKGTGALYTTVLFFSILAAIALHVLNTFILCKLHKKPMPKYHFEKIDLTDWKKDKKRKVSACLRYSKRHKKKVTKNLLKHFVCVILCMMALFPVCILVINATKTQHEIIQGFSLLPGGNFFENYLSVKGYMDNSGNNIYTAILRSCAISGSSAILATYFGGLCAYGFEHYEFPCKKFLWSCVFASLMIAPISGAVGFLRVVISIHMYNTLLPLILIGIATPSCAYFFRLYLHSMKLQEVIEAARIDGCKEFMIFNKIIFPIMTPAIFLQLIFNFATSWNNTVYQSLVLTDVKKKTISLFLRILVGNKGAGSDPVVYCILLVTTLPPLVVYILFSNGIMAQINLGSVKE